MIWLPSTRADLPELAGNLRASDRHEAAFNAAATGRDGPGWSVLGDLEGAFHKFQHWTLWHPEGLVGMAGVAPLRQNPAIGAIWFLGTDLADTHWLAMTRASIRFIAMQSGDWFAVGNIVPKHMTARRRWLEHLGFDFEDAEAHPNMQGHVAFWSRPLDGPKDGPAAP